MAKQADLFPLKLFSTETSYLDITDNCSYLPSYFENFLDAKLSVNA